MVLGRDTGGGCETKVMVRFKSDSVAEVICIDRIRSNMKNNKFRISSILKEEQ